MSGIVGVSFGPNCTTYVWRSSFCQYTQSRLMSYEKSGDDLTINELNISGHVDYL